MQTSSASYSLSKKKCFSSHILVIYPLTTLIIKLNSHLQNIIIFKKREEGKGREAGLNYWKSTWNSSHSSPVNSMFTFNHWVIRINTSHCFKLILVKANYLLQIQGNILFPHKCINFQEATIHSNMWALANSSNPPFNTVVHVYILIKHTLLQISG